MRADLAALGVRLGWAARDDKEELALTIVLQRLRHEGDGVLLIFDNAPDADAIRTYLPRGGASRIIITSNAPAWRGVAEPVEIRVWPKEIGADYLIRRTGRTAERDAAEELSVALGGLPLAHEQAAAYCERLDIPLREYRQRFENAPARMLDTEKDAPHDYYDRRTVSKTFALAIDEAAKIHPAAEALIVHAALLPPEPIPLYLFTEAREKFAEPLASALAGDGFDEAIAALRTFALISRETITDERDPAITTDALRLHRLVREVAVARKTQVEREIAHCALINAIAEVYPQSVEEHPETWPLAVLLNALAADLVPTNGALPLGAELSASAVMDGWGRYSLAIGAYAAAGPLLERALAIREKALGPEHPDTAMGLNNFAELLQGQGKLAEARPLYERALAIDEKALGPEHPDTAMGLNNLAAVLQNQGKFPEARPLLERALAIREKALGPEHPDTAQSLNNLAVLRMASGNIIGARLLMQRAIAISAKALGPKHPTTVALRKNLAGMTSRPHRR